MALRRERMRLGDMLIKQNVLTEDELKKALELQKGSGGYNDHPFQSQYRRYPYLM